MGEWGGWNDPKKLDIRGDGGSRIGKNYRTSFMNDPLLYLVPMFWYCYWSFPARDSLTQRNKKNIKLWPCCGLRIRMFYMMHIFTVTRKFPVYSNGWKERLKCNFHSLGYYRTPNLSIHQNSTQELTWNFYSHFTSIHGAKGQFLWDKILTWCFLANFLSKLQRFFIWNIK